MPMKAAHIYYPLTEACPENATVLVQCALEAATDPQGLLPLQLAAYKPTIDKLRQHQNKVLILVAAPLQQSVRFLQAPLATTWQTDVTFCPDCKGRAAQQAIKALPPGDVLLLENTCLYAEEAQGDATFAQQLATLADAYVHEALGQWHIPTASLTQLPALLPAYLGIAHGTDMARLAQLKSKTARPLTIALGGQDLGLLMPALKHSITLADQILLAGSLTAVALMAKDMATPETDALPYDIENLRDMWVEAGIRGCRILLAQDVVYQTAQGPDTCTAETLPHKAAILDIGPRTIEAWSQNFQRGGTVFWHGHLGASTLPEAAEGTNNLANALLHSAATVYVSGLDTLHTLHESRLLPHMAQFSPVGDGILQRLLDV